MKYSVTARGEALGCPFATGLKDFQRVIDSDRKVVVGESIIPYIWKMHPPDYNHACKYLTTKECMQRGCRIGEIIRVDPILKKNSAGKTTERELSHEITHNNCW